MNKRISILNAGTLAGVISFAAYLLLFYTLELTPADGLGYFIWVIPIAFFYFAITRYRDRQKDGYITAASAFQNGLLFSFVYASLLAMLLVLHAQFDTSYFDANVHAFLQEFGKTKKDYLDAGMKEQYEMTIDLLESAGSLIFVFSMFFNAFFANVFSAIFVALAIKRNPPTETELDN